MHIYIGSVYFCCELGGNQLISFLAAVHPFWKTLFWAQGAPKQMFPLKSKIRFFYNYYTVLQYKISWKSSLQPFTHTNDYKFLWRQLNWPLVGDLKLFVKVCMSIKLISPFFSPWDCKQNETKTVWITCWQYLN